MVGLWPDPEDSCTYCTEEEFDESKLSSNTLSDMVTNSFVSFTILMAFVIYLYGSVCVHRMNIGQLANQEILMKTFGLMSGGKCVNLCIVLFLNLFIYR